MWSIAQHALVTSLAQLARSQKLCSFVHVSIVLQLTASLQYVPYTYHACGHDLSSKCGLIHIKISGLFKVYRLPCMEEEILQATVDKEAFPTYVLAEAAALNKYEFVLFSSSGT